MITPLPSQPCKAANAPLRRLLNPSLVARCAPAGVCAAFILLALAFSVLVPPFENLDESEHFGVIRFIAETGRLPTHGGPAAEVYHYRQEASQPPLYHLFAAGVTRLLGLPNAAPADLRLNPWVACGPGGAGVYDNRAVLYHNPNREAFPWRGALLTLHILRGLSILLQTATVAAAYALGRLAFPARREVALLGMAIVAFNPQFLLVASGVNNDNLLTPLVTLGLCLLLRIWRDGPTARRVFLLGLVAGLAGLSKLSGWLLLPFACLVILLQAWRARQAGRFAICNLQFALMQCIVICAVALSVGGWWFWRNWRLYGDPTALRPMLEVVGVRGAPLWQSFLESGALFRSFWGQLPCAFYPGYFYAFYAAFAVVGTLGLVWGWRRRDASARRALLLLGGWFTLILLSWARWNAMTPAPGGRLLFSALPALALLLATGIANCKLQVASCKLQIANLPFAICHLLFATCYLLLAAWTAAVILPGFFAPPRRYAEADAIRPARALDAEFGGAVRLLGYAAEGDGRGLDVTLYWQAAAPLAEDYTLAMQLVSPIPGDEALRWNYNSWPGRGNYPTSAWLPGEIIADRYRFRLPEADFPTQAWNLHLALYRAETGERLPVRLGGVDGGDHLTLARFRIAGRAPVCPEEGRLETEARFGPAVSPAAALTHVTVSESGEVVLCWRSLRPLPADYTVFVHLLDENGALLTTGDGPPAGGAFPTSLWRRGDVIRDVHRVEMDGRGRAVAVGLYHWEDGARLPVTMGGREMPDGAVVVGLESRK